MGFIRGNVIRDLAALNKVELLPRDGWGRITDHSPVGSDDDNALVDAIASITAEPNPDQGAISAIYGDDPLLRPSAVVSFFGDGGTEQHNVAELETVR